MAATKSRHKDERNFDGGMPLQEPPCARTRPSDIRLFAPSQRLGTHAGALRAHVEKLAAARKDDVHTFEFAGQRYVIKHGRTLRYARTRAWANVMLCAVLFGEFPSAKRLRTGDIHHEALRLQDLASQGVLVPQVYLVTDDHIVLEHCGPTVETLLSTTTPHRRDQLLWSVVDDLAKFHHAGHWHGGAQLRNLTVKAGSIYRIDFEENVGAALSLPLAQAYDVLLAFCSIVDHLRDDHHAAGVRLLTHYLDRVRSGQVVNSLKKLEYWLNHLRRIEPYFNYRLARNRDVQRVRKFAWILTGALEAYRVKAARRITPYDR